MQATIRLITAVILVLAFVPFMAAAADKAPVDFSGFWAVKYEREPSGKELLAKIPKGAIRIDDGGGKELGKGDYGGLKLSEKAQEEIRTHDFDAEFSIENTCVLPSSAYYMQAPFPLEIHQADKLVILKMEYFDMVRIIFVDGRKIPEDAPHSKNGYSVGHWEGNELVVRTEKLKEATLMNNGFSHSENLVMTERFKLSKDGQTLWLIQLYEDPEVFTPMGARYISWSKREGEHVYPYECDYSFGQ